MNVRPLVLATLAFASVALVSDALASSRAEPDFSAWLEDATGMAEAARQYRDEAKPIFVYFYTDWCGYCRQFERDLLSTEPVADYLDGEEVLAVRINAERGPAEAEISRRYGVRGFPALFMLSSESGSWSAVDRMVLEAGRPKLKDPGAFVDTLKQASAR